MMYSENFLDRVLFQPLESGADHLKIVTGYATHTMASWHLTEVAEHYHTPISITLLIGMCRYDGLSIDVHQGFHMMMREKSLPGNCHLTCQYVYEGPPVHSKLYIWENTAFRLQHS